MEGCQKISEQEYESQKIDYTKKALEELNQQLQQAKPNKLRNRKNASIEDDFDPLTPPGLFEDSYSESGSDIDLLSDEEEESRTNKITIISDSNPKRKVRKTANNDKVMSKFMNTFTDLNKNNSKIIQKIMNLKSKNSSFKKEINSLENKLHFLKLEHSNSNIELEKLKERYSDLERKNKLLIKRNDQVLANDYWFRNVKILYQYLLYISICINLFFYIFYL